MFTRSSCLILISFLSAACTHSTSLGDQMLGVEGSPPLNGTCSGALIVCGGVCSKTCDGGAGELAIGHACMTAGDCGEGYYCYRGTFVDAATNGYCLLGTASEPSVCTQDSECPANTFCSPVWQHNSPPPIPGAVCLAGCTSAAACRSGYACAQVYKYGPDGGTYGGVTTPPSSHDVCWMPAQ